MDRTVIVVGLRNGIVISASVVSQNNKENVGEDILEFVGSGLEVKVIQAEYVTIGKPLIDKLYTGQEKCPDCGGSGYRKGFDPKDTVYGEKLESLACPVCHGTGLKPEKIELEELITDYIIKFGTLENPNDCLVLAHELLTEIILPELKRKYVRLAKDQSLPAVIVASNETHNFGDWSCWSAYEKAQRDMLKAGFRKIHPEDLEAVK